MTDDARSSDEIPDAHAVFDGRTIQFPRNESDSGRVADAKPDSPSSDFPHENIVNPTDGGEPLCAESASEVQEPNSDDATFLSFFDTADSKQQAHAFQKNFHSFFEKAAEKIDDLVDDLADDDTDDDASDEDGGAIPDEDDWSVDEIMQREATEALDANIDAMIRRSDAETLFVLGAKFESAEEYLDTPESVEHVTPKSILEAMLFVGDRENRPLALDKAVLLMRNVSVGEALDAIEQLNRRYAEVAAPYRIVSDGEGVRLSLIPELEPVRTRFFGKTREAKLSQKAIDVLAIIAYRQPISLAEIEEIRNHAAGIVTQLLKRDLVAMEARTVEKKSVPYFRTTDRFLKLIGIDSLDDLPIVEEIDYR